jgi:hypothetical protein
VGAGDASGVATGVLTGVTGAEMEGIGEDNQALQQAMAVGKSMWKEQ